jgi:methylmalonyl-CoA/ethylmalonyl-CoA epimerase
MIRVGDCYIQLLSSLSADTPVGRFVERRGEGLHHIAYEVEDIEAALGTLASEGVRLIDTVARPGSRNTRVAFVHPDATLGVLIELVQYPRGTSGSRGAL